MDTEKAKRTVQRLVATTTALYEGTKSRVRTLGGVMEEFEIGVGVCQGSGFNPLLYITMMEDAKKAARDGVPWELLYADDLVLTAEGVGDMFNRWKTGMEQRGIKINTEKTKLMVGGKAANGRVQCGRWPCCSCGRGVGVNSIQFVECNQRCSGLRNLRGVQNFVCPRRGQQHQQNERENLVVDGGELE